MGQSQPHVDTEMNGYSLCQFYRKTFLRNADPKQSKMSNFHFDLSLKLSQGEVHDFSGEVENNLRGGAHLPTPPLKIQPCLHIVVILFYFILLCQLGSSHHNNMYMWALSLWDETNLEGNNFWLFLLFSHEDWVQVALGKFSPRLEPAALEVKGRCANHFATEARKNNNNASIICFHHPWRAGNPGGI